MPTVDGRNMMLTSNSTNEGSRMWRSDDMLDLEDLGEKNDVRDVVHALLEAMGNRGNPRIMRSWKPGHSTARSTKYILEDGRTRWFRINPGVVEIHDRGKRRGEPLAELRTPEDAQRWAVRDYNPFLHRGLTLRAHGKVGARKRAT